MNRKQLRQFRLYMLVGGMPQAIATYIETNNFRKVDEELFIETLDNGITVYMYPTKKTKNFYLSISVKYGACVEKYKVGNKVFDIIPGSAHFLEHKVMALSENVEISTTVKIWLSTGRVG